MDHSILYAPQIIRESSRGFSTISLQDDMLGNREVMIIGEINAETVNSLVAQLLYLKREDPIGKITAYVNSPGGEVTSGLALYDVMQSISCPIRMVCTGIAASMASLLFVAGDEREMLCHSRLMLHDPLIAKTGGSALELNAVAEDLMRTRQAMAEIYSAHSGKTVEEIFDITSRDTYFTPKKAIEYGLADKVIETL